LTQTLHCSKAILSTVFARQYLAAYNSASICQASINLKCSLLMSSFRVLDSFNYLEKLPFLPQIAKISSLSHQKGFSF